MKQALLAICPLDGRYIHKLKPLINYFSEGALIRYRVLVEVEYFIALHENAVGELSPLDDEQVTKLRQLYGQWGLDKALAIKEIEGKTNHDVKAVEYWLKAQLADWSDQRLLAVQEFIHFGLTSQDINNTAIPMSLLHALEEALLPALRRLHTQLEARAEAWRDIPMLARTHGQAASPTGLGKEIAVFAARLQAQVAELAQLPVPGKFGGATGNFNAHLVAFPEIDWKAFADAFVERRLGLDRSSPTTQIEWYDGLARIFDCISRINTLLIDLCRDLWQYVSMNYFSQEVKAGEIGSSAMPHKVNPIDFENAEGNLGLSNALLGHLGRKLPISRLQRDLSDSTVLRNLGTALGYALLAWQALDKGLQKLSPRPEVMAHDLDQNWAVLSEAIQSVLRAVGYPQPYEALKELTRGQRHIDQQSLATFIQGLDVSEEIKSRLLALRPETYVGDALKKCTYPKTRP